MGTHSGACALTDEVASKANAASEAKVPESILRESAIIKRMWF